MSNTLRTYKQIYKHYTERNQQIPDPVSEILELFLSKLQGKRVLDVGCANGRDAKFFYDKGLEVTGIDFTPGFVEISKEVSPGAEFLVMDMRELDFPAETFDGLWVCASFLHIPKAEALDTLRGFRKVLAQDGVLYVSVMEGATDEERENKNHSWGLRHFSDYFTEELASLLSQAGFNVDEIVRKPADNGKFFLHSFSTR